MRRRVRRPVPLPRLHRRRASTRAAILSGPGASGGWPPPAKPPDSARRRSSARLNRPRRRPRTPTSQSGLQKAAIGSASWNYKLWGPARLILCPTLMRIHYLIDRQIRANICQLTRLWTNGMTVTLKTPLEVPHIKLFLIRMPREKTPCRLKKGNFSIDTYAVECSTCQNWRIIPSKLKYEQIRENIIQVPFSCKYVHGWRPQITCHAPTDISEGNGMVWAIDKPGIPQTPPGWERKITLRSEQGTRFAYVYYISLAGKTIRSMKELKKYIEDNPDYAAGLQLSQFSFKVPKPPNRPRQSEPIQPAEVVHEDPVHNYMPVPHGEANPVTHIPVTLALQVPVMPPKKRKLNQ